MKKFIMLVIAILSIVSCSKMDKNYRNYDGKHYGTQFSEEGLTLVSSVSSPNYVGGVNVYLNVKNNTGRTIKYLSINGDMRNIFGDNVYCEIWDSMGMPIEITGPIYDGQDITYVTNNCFYNPNAKTYCINAVSITYFE